MTETLEVVTSPRIELSRGRLEERGGEARIHPGGSCDGVVVGHASAPAIVHFFDAGAEVEGAAISYLRISFVGQIFLFMTLALSASYQASGDTRTPMLFNVAVVTLNAVLDPFFIFTPRQVVFGGVPLGWLGWGVDGAAIADAAGGCGRVRSVSRISLRRANRSLGRRTNDHA